MEGEGRRERLPISERNTSQVPRLLCCTMEREGETPPAGGGGEGVSACCISGLGPDHCLERERGWGPPGRANQQHLE